MYCKGASDIQNQYLYTLLIHQIPDTCTMLNSCNLCRFTAQCIIVGFLGQYRYRRANECVISLIHVCRKMLIIKWPFSSSLVLHDMWQRPEVPVSDVPKQDAIRPRGAA